MTLTPLPANRRKRRFAPPRTADTGEPAVSPNSAWLLEPPTRS